MDTDTDTNTYAPPKSNLDAGQDQDDALASRWTRLWASIIDGIPILIVTISVLYFMGGFEGAADGVQPSFFHSLSSALLGIFTFAMINTKSLINSGQTLGKKILNIKIVGGSSGSLPSKSQLLKRYATYFVPGQVPFVGPLFSLVNILFIFGSRKRCIHDLAGDTKVVMC